jgi:hypothetical protein
MSGGQAKMFGERVRLGRVDNHALALARGRFTYDPDTGLFYAKHSWNKLPAGRQVGNLDTAGYVQIFMTVDMTRYALSAHRLAWAFVYKGWPELEIDHINRIPSDNRIANLRLATRAQNNINRRLKTSSKSGVRGVHWDAHSKKWRATLTLNGKKLSLGLYTDPHEAGEAFKRAAIEHGRWDHIGQGAA